MGSGSGEAALHKERLCDLLGRLVTNTQGSGFQKDGAPEQLSLLLLFHPFKESENYPRVCFFFFFFKSCFVHLT